MVGNGFHSCGSSDEQLKGDLVQLHETYSELSKAETTSGMLGETLIIRFLLKKILIRSAIFKTYMKF